MESKDSFYYQTMSELDCELKNLAVSEMHTVINELDNLVKRWQGEGYIPVYQVKEVIRRHGKR